MKARSSLYGILSIAFSFATSIAFTQILPKVQLSFINDFPIKIDGGCSFYTFAANSLDSDKYVFVVSAKNIGL